MAESVVWVGCIIFFLTALISFLFSWLLSHISLVDRPVARSSHAKPTPTAGGIAFVAGLGVGAFILAFSSFLSPDDRLQLSKLLGLGLCVAAFGLWDDLVTPGAFFKLIFMAILSLVTVWVFSPVTVFPLTQTFSLSLPVTIGFLGSALWIFTVMNTVNFIDGANGMLGGSLGLASLGLAGFCAWDGAFVPMITALGLTAVVLGFLPWNLREKACLFAGDTGALLLGFLFAGASLIWSANTGKGQIYIVVFLLLVLLLDVGLTLIWRLKKGAAPASGPSRSPLPAFDTYWLDTQTCFRTLCRFNAWLCSFSNLSHVFWIPGPHSWAHLSYHQFWYPQVIYSASGRRKTSPTHHNHKLPL